VEKSGKRYFFEQDVINYLLEGDTDRFFS
jgi:hypothetical protein